MAFTGSRAISAGLFLGEESSKITTSWKLSLKHYFYMAQKTGSNYGKR